MLKKAHTPRTCHSDGASAASRGGIWKLHGFVKAVSLNPSVTTQNPEVCRISGKIVKYRVKRFFSIDNRLPNAKKLV